jgi:predicted aspartyl protease
MPTKPIEIFYSYSHKDEALRKKLETHLSILKKQGVISAWHDRCIPAGSSWAKAIDEHLNTADIILLLVSADFLASDYCYEKEMSRAMERHELKEARVIPVILRDCDWEFALFSKLQALPRDGKPVTAWSSRDRAFKDVAVGIRNIAEELTRSPAVPAQNPPILPGTPKNRPSVKLYRSPTRNTLDLRLFGPRLEIEVGLPVVRNSAGKVVSPRGTSVRMPALIDLGASRTVVSPAAVERAGLRRIGTTTLARVGGLENNVNVYLAAISFPRSELSTIEFMEIVACDLAYPLVHCLLGRDIVSRWIFTYDGPLGEWEIREDGASSL